MRNSTFHMCISNTKIATGRYRTCRFIEKAAIYFIRKRLFTTFFGHQSSFFTVFLYFLPQPQTMDESAFVAIKHLYIVCFIPSQAIYFMLLFFVRWIEQMIKTMEHRENGFFYFGIYVFSGYERSAYVRQSGSHTHWKWFIIEFFSLFLFRSEFLMNWLDECRKNLTQHTNIYQSYYTDIDYQETEIYSRCVCIWASHRKWIVNEKTTYLFVCVFFSKNMRCMKQKQHQKNMK